MGRIKITNRFLISSQKFIITRYGVEAWNRVLENADQATRDVYAAKIKPKKNCDFEIVASVLKGVEVTLVEDHPDVLFRMGLFNSAEDLSATQKLVMKLISPEWVLRMAAFLWSQRVINGGTIQIDNKGKKHVTATVSDFSEPIDQWWTYLSGWFTTAINFSGGKNVQVQWITGGETPTAPAVFDARWN